MKIESIQEAQNPEIGITGYNVWAGFIKKVYCILFCQLGFTTILIGIFIGTGTTQAFVNSEDKMTKTGSIVLIIGLVLYLLTSFGLMCFKRFVRRVPINYFLLVVNTCSQTMMAIVSAALTSTAQVIIAALLTVTITVVLSIYAWKSTTRISTRGAIIWVLGWYVGVTIIQIAINFGAIPIGIGFSIVSGLIVAVFGFFIVKDTQMIIDGKRNSWITMDDYVLGAVLLYTDIIQTFITFMGKR